MAKKNKGTVKNLDAELVIIGGGGGGLAAAMSAVENGINKVIVLEKLRALGGNTARAIGLFGVESPVQRRMAIDATRDSVFRNAMDYAHWKSDARIVRAVIDKSGDTIRWLEEKGMEIECVALFNGQCPLVFHRPKGLCAEMTNVLAKDCKKLGVKLLTRTPAKKLLTGSKGKVKGVVAESQGKQFTINTKSVIIASGGYGANKKLLKKYYPFYNDKMRCEGLPLTGDGILMAIEIGADTEVLGLLIGGGSLPQGGLAGAERAPLVLGLAEPYLVRVNHKGRRFIDESIPCHEHPLWGSENIQAAYIIFDHKMVQYMMEHGTYTFVNPDKIERCIPLPELEKDLKNIANKGAMKISSSWDDIAKYIGCDSVSLKNTIDEYNAYCDQGYDPIFAKERRYLVPLRTPPYYAIGGTTRRFLDTIGGIKINENMEVLNKKDDPIPGLYAAGVVAGCWQAIGYCQNYLSGTAVGFAVNSGRIAGESAVKYILGN